MASKYEDFLGGGKALAFILHYRPEDPVEALAGYFTLKTIGVEPLEAVLSLEGLTQSAEYRLQSCSEVSRIIRSLNRSENKFTDKQVWSAVKALLVELPPWTTDGVKVLCLKVGARGMYGSKLIEVLHHYPYYDSFFRESASLFAALDINNCEAVDRDLVATILEAQKASASVSSGIGSGSGSGSGGDTATRRTLASGLAALIERPTAASTATLSRSEFVSRLFAASSLGSLPSFTN